MSLKIGALFAGMGGLDLAVESVLDSRVSWVAEFDDGPSRILARRYPHAPNLRDVTQVDWSQVEPVDVITGGSPCQDLSHAGKRAGMKDGTRSGLWAAMCDAIETIRPSLVIWENVRGALSAPAEGGINEHEPCVCGGTDRRGRLHPSGHPTPDVPRASVGRNDQAGAAATRVAQGGVGRDALSAPARDGALGGGLDLASDRHAGDGAAPGDPSVPAPQGGAGGRGAGSRADSSATPPEGERSVRMDGGGASVLRVREPAAALAECEVPSCACVECGGCIDAAGCEVGPCAFCMDDRDGPSLRALGRVLGDLAELGYDAGWCGLRAADVGAPHGRWRVFVVAWRQDDAAALTWRQDDAAALTWRQDDAAALLPTPVVNDMGKAYTPEAWDEWTARLKASHGNGNGHGASLSIEALRLLKTPTSQLAVNGGSQHPDKRKAGGHGPTLADKIEHLLPTPTAHDAKGTGPSQASRNSPGLDAVTHLLPTPSVADVEGGRKARSGTRSDELLLNGIAAEQRFGDYTPAIARWEAVLGRPAPDPTEPTGKDGAHRLSPRFVEFMMGLPSGWVTDPAIWEGMKPSTARNAQLKALGNGVVPQQAAAAIRHMLVARASSLKEAA